MKNAAEEIQNKTKRLFQETVREKQDEWAFDQASRTDAGQGSVMHGSRWNIELKKATDNPVRWCKRSCVMISAGRLMQIQGSVSILPICGVPISRAISLIIVLQSGVVRIC